MNLIVICLDTFRADCLGALGRNPDIRTPHLDRLAAEGVVFENAFGEGQPTIEYRRALVTGMRTFPWCFDYDTRGLWPHGHGWHKICPAHDTLAEILLEQGYLTGFFSDTYHMFKATQNFTRGFASYEFVRGQETDNYRTGSLAAIDVKRFVPPDVKPEEANPALVQYLLNMQDRREERDWTSAQVFEKAGRFLEDNRENGPLFLWVDSFDPHEPWDPPKRFADMYDPDWSGGWEPIHGYYQHDERSARRARALYWGECSFVDELVGGLLAKVDELGMRQDTLVVVTSDHGTELGDHGAFQKGRHNCRYRHNSEILLMMRLPGGKGAGKRVEALAQNHDVLPTALEVLGAPRGEVDGESLVPLIEGEVEKVRDFAITGWGERASVRNLEHNYSVDFTSPELNEHLFDSAEDPGEIKNVAAQRPEVCSRHRQQLEMLLRQNLPAHLRDKIYPSNPPFRAWLKSEERRARLRR
jgi:arylsulfatase A-like enzyme